ncbi:MAG: TIGR02452 family protein [Clostridia bacterium]|nr:TIGR02452 family protein [Clostridia bacterium]
MPDLENLSPEEIERLMREMQKKEYEGLSPEEAEKKKRAKEAEKERNISLLGETREIFRLGFYEAEGAAVNLEGFSDLARARVFLPEEIEALKGETFIPAHETTFDCLNLDSLSLAKKRAAEGKRCLVLNLASSSRPGGAASDGANGQEESLCRKSSLLCSLQSEAAAGYYELGKAQTSRLATDAVIISPQVAVIRGEGDALLRAPYEISVMSCSAPMVRLGFEGKKREEYEKMLFGRVEGMLRCAAGLGFGHLILGAFGCGAFGNDAALVSRAFYEALTGPLNGVFESVEFAILCKDGDDYNFKKFSELFGKKGGGA